MTVPLNTVAGSTNPLTCPNAKTYYTHEGSPTSAQYYINNKGISEATACQWDSDGSDMGNWAPSYLGVGTDQSGSTWLSIASTAQNNPSNYQPLDYTVEITGDNLSGKCKLSGGQYCSGVDYSDCNSSGCTVIIHAHRSFDFVQTKSSTRSKSCPETPPMSYHRVESAQPFTT